MRSRSSRSRHGDGAPAHAQSSNLPPLIKGRHHTQSNSWALGGIDQTWLLTVLASHTMPLHDSASSPATIGRRRIKASNGSSNSQCSNGHSATLHTCTGSGSTSAAAGGVSADLAYLTNKKSSLPTTTNSRRAQRRKGRLGVGHQRFRRGDSDLSARRRGTNTNTNTSNSMKYIVVIFALAVIYTAITSGGRQRAVRAALRRRRRAASLLRKKSGVADGTFDEGGAQQADQDAAQAEADDVERRRQANNEGRGETLTDTASGWKFWKRLGRGDAPGHGYGQSEVPKEHGVWSPNRKYKWIDVKQLPPLPGQEDMIDRSILEGGLGRRPDKRSAKDFRVRHAGEPPMPWEAEADDDGMRRHTATSLDTNSMRLQDERKDHHHHGRGITGGSSPRVDYTSIKYTYPPTLPEPPVEGGYPFLEPLGTLMTRWPQDDIDNPPQPFVERLQHFDYNDPEQVAMALKFRDAELPFKVYNVPEVVAAGKKWTDKYISSQFDALRRKKNKTGLLDTVLGGDGGGGGENANGGIPMTKGHCQEAKGNFFSFFQPMNWEPRTMGPPPTMDNDWTYSRWAKHARYADKVGLDPTEQHYYWQAGIPKEERLQSEDKWTFVSRDLPSFSSPEPTFFGFMPEMQKGIQCRFGERGVTAATHYDAGRNMVAMMSGAKRYVLSPPKACPKLGIVTRRQHPVFRHSLLNFGYLNLLESDDPEVQTMPEEERAWLEVAKDSMAVETVLKAGEVLYIPSHWFHYITSLQKSAQCNTRSGRDKGDHPEHGGFEDVMECVGEGA